MVLGWVKEWSFRNIKFHERGILSYIIQYKSPLNIENGQFPLNVPLFCISQMLDIISLQFACLER